MTNNNVYVYVDQTHGFVVTPLEHKFLGVADENGNLQTDGRIAKVGEKLVVETKFAAIDIGEDQVLTFSTTDENWKASLTQNPIEVDDYDSFHYEVDKLESYAASYTAIHG